MGRGLKFALAFSMSLKLSFLLTLIMLLPPTLAFSAEAAGCADEDLSERLGPVRSQGNIGWCYANTAADLISFKFRDQWPKDFQASAVFIALGYNYKQNSNEPGNYIFTEGGDIRAAVSYAREFNYSCPRNLDDIFITGGFNLQIKQKLRIAENLKLLFSKRNKSPHDLEIYHSYIQDLRNKNSIIMFISDEALERALSLDVNHAVVEMAKEVCKPYQLPMTLTREQINRYFSDDKEYYDKNLKKRIYQTPDLMKMIDQQITNKNVVGIDYAMRLISQDLKDEDSHASVIVGRRSRNGQCQYKIRNSWGSECDYTGNDGKKYSRYNSKVECEKGHVWVKSSDLKSAMSGIVYIDQ